MTGPRLGIRAAINARLEEVSFRTGMMTGAITLLGLAAVTAVAMITAMPSHGTPVNGAAAAPTTSSSPVSIAVVPVAARTSRTAAHRHPEVVSTPAAQASQSATQASDVDSGSGRQYGSSGSSGRRYDSTGGSTSWQYGRGSQQGSRGGYGTGGWNGAGQSGLGRSYGGNQGGF
jgi:hypothetical protein